MDMDPFARDTLHALAGEDGPLYAPTGRLRKSASAASVTRADVIRAFQHSFEMIGGVPRLALWADENPTDFYKLYGRLLPASSTAELDGPQELIIRHAIPPPMPYQVPPGHPQEIDITPPRNQDSDGA